MRGDGNAMEEERKREWCYRMMTSDPRLARMILTYFNEDDFQRIEDHKTGDGVIGGKSCGFLLVCGDRDFLSGS